MTDERPAARSDQATTVTLATLYTAFLLFAAGLSLLLVSLIFYAPPRSCSP